jgi:hypothetical protein
MLDTITERITLWMMINELHEQRDLAVTPRLRCAINQGVERGREAPRLFGGTAEDLEGSPFFWRLVRRCQLD